MKKILIVLMMFSAILNAQNTPWSTTGNIGIGTTGPLSPLHLYSTGAGTIRIERGASGNQNNYLEMFFTGTPATGITVGTGSTIFRANGNAANNTDMAFMPKNNLLGLIIKADGKIGLNGITNPAASLQINGDAIMGSTNTGARWKLEPSTGTSGDYFKIGYDDVNGNFRYPIAISRAVGLGQSRIGIGTENTPIQAKLHVVYNYPVNQTGAKVEVLALERRADNNLGVSTGLWKFFLGPNSVNSNQANLTLSSDLGSVLALEPNGNGTLGGKLTCKEIKVTNTITWPDYVFDSNYQLLSLDSVESFILENKHLPNIPSELDIQNEEGFDVGKMNTLLLQKVEELTLYVIQLQKEINNLKK
jgi:hypothetical protein